MRNWPSSATKLTGFTIVSLIALGVWAFTSRVTDDPKPHSDSNGAWHLVFDDEFESDTLDSSAWVTCYWWDLEGCTNLGNSELQWYRPDQVSVHQGVAVLTAEAQPAIGWEGAEFPYRSGLISTGRATSDLDEEPRFAFQYGYAEMRARVPSGQGLWAAFWMLPVTHESKPEIDVFEILGDNPGEFIAHLHWLDDEGERQNLGHKSTDADLSDGFHIYAVEWSEDSLVWFVDGVERWRVDDAAIVPSEPLYLIANLAVGGDYPGPPDETTEFPANLEIDYVRVWQPGDPK